MASIDTTNKKDTIREGVIILIYQEGLIKGTYRVLLVKQRSGKWSLPSGGIEATESPLQAARRELEEETGLTNIQLKQTPIINEFSYTPTSHGRQVSFIGAYEKKPIPGTQFEEEISAIEWIEEKDLPLYLTRPNQYQTCMQILEYK